MESECRTRLLSCRSIRLVITEAATQIHTHSDTHTQASDICRQLVPWQLAANWIIVCKGERRSEDEGGKKRKKKSGKQAGERKRD